MSSSGGQAGASSGGGSWGDQFNNFLGNAYGALQNATNLKGPDAGQNILNLVPIGWLENGFEGPVKRFTGTDLTGYTDTQLNSLDGSTQQTYTNTKDALAVQTQAATIAATQTASQTADIAASQTAGSNQNQQKATDAAIRGAQYSWSTPQKSDTGDFLGF